MEAIMDQEQNNPIRDLFETLKDLIRKHGDNHELIHNKIHVLETDPDPNTTHEAVLRIYHADGYCCDVIYREYVDHEDSFMDNPYEWLFYDDYEGFDPVGLTNMIKIVDDLKKDLS